MLKKGIAKPLPQKCVKRIANSTTFGEGPKDRFSLT